LLIATLWARMLESAGVRCEIRNQFIGAALGDIPADQAAPEIWIQRDSDLPRARTLLAEWQSPEGLPSWHCPGCGEALEGQFFQCWKCAATQFSSAF
jgi:hypothetical protein